MSRIKLKCGGRPKRKKALFGELAVAGATLAAAGMQVAATQAAAKQQSKAIVDNAKSNADALRAQNENNTRLMEKQVDTQKQLTTEQNNILKDMTLAQQLQAGQQNMTNYQEQNKQIAKYGTRKRTKLKKINSYQPFYGGGSSFTVTDGGYVVEEAAYPDGSKLYSVIGNDHEHYHKTPSGKYKSGVGIKTRTGDVIEVEGNQNKNTSEFIYDDKSNGDILAISNHNIPGTDFNPADAVRQGIHPLVAGNIQEYGKQLAGIDSEGNKAKCGKKISLRRKAENGAFWNNYSGAIINAGGNIIGAGLNWLGNSLASRYITKANNKAAQYMIDAYSNMRGIDMSNYTRDAFIPDSPMAAVQAPNIRYNTDRGKIERRIANQNRNINRNTLSSAAQLNRLAKSNEALSEQLAAVSERESNANQNIIQGNMERITNTAVQAANLKAQANQTWANTRMQGDMFNAGVENEKLAGIAQARADALTQNANIRANALQSGITGLGSALTTSAQGFASTFDGLRNERNTLRNIGIGADRANWVEYLATNPDVQGNREEAFKRWKLYKNSENTNNKEYARILAEAYGFDDTPSTPIVPTYIPGRRGLFRNFSYYNE